MLELLNQLVRQFGDGDITIDELWDQIDVELGTIDCELYDVELI